MIKIPASKHKTRCIDTDGTRCPQLRTARMGSIWTCLIYHEQEGRHWPSLPEEDGCLMRLPECLAAECGEK